MASFSLQRSWASLFRALLLQDDREILSNSSLRSGTSDSNPFGLNPVLQRLNLISKAVPLFASQRIRSGRGLSALLSFLTSRASPSKDLSRKSSPFSLSPFAPSRSKALQLSSGETLGFPLSLAWLSPNVLGAGPFGLSRLQLPATSSRKS